MERTATLDVATVAVVGDTMVDLEAAANAGARWRIGVCTGVATRAALAAFAGARVLDSIASLRSLWPDWG
jgi:phosphoglycolate phosphatase-like HAD superfamily hydrolase